MTCASLRRPSTLLVTLVLNVSMRALSLPAPCCASGALEASISAKSAVAVLIFMAGLPRWPAFLDSRARQKAVNAISGCVGVERGGAAGVMVRSPNRGPVGFSRCGRRTRQNENERAVLRDGTKEEAPCDHSLPLEYWVLFLPFHRRMPPPSRVR